MKYTRNDSNAVIEVRGCTTCPHMAKGFGNNEGFMFCEKPMAEKTKRHKKLTSHWTGAYHASCPLPSDAKMVPENPKIERPF